MNPHTKFPVSPLAMFASLWRNRSLIATLVKREVVGRYRGSIMGLAWSFFNPLLMLVIYTFVFSVVFKARWGTGGEESKADFAILLFVGMIVHGLFAECVNRAPGLILSNVNYVKKVIFPLEILPAANVGAALVHFLITLGLIFGGALVWSAPLQVSPTFCLNVSFDSFTQSACEILAQGAALLQYFSTKALHCAAAAPPPLPPREPELEHPDAKSADPHIANINLPRSNTVPPVSGWCEAARDAV